MKVPNVQIEESWQHALTAEFSKDYFSQLTDFVRSEYRTASVYPPPREIFSAFNLCPFDKVRVVIIGQDPYHGPNQANGLAFSVHKNVTIPPSLKNIFKEISSDTLRSSCATADGDLTRWATQGVLLLNATLTVRAGCAGSHQGKGWELFTDAVIESLSKERKHIVFMLWGSYARRKGVYIDRACHLVLESAHPSPLSAHNGFFGCKHFSQANEYLHAHGLEEVVW